VLTRELTIQLRIIKPGRQSGRLNIVYAGQRGHLGNSVPTHLNHPSDG
jgi:hypothetical protein